jgi:hypothetical protein
LPSCINDAGHVAGADEDTAGVGHGFAHGRFATFDAPDAVPPEALDINDCGDVVGIYREGDGKSCGFMLRDGVDATIDAPGATEALASAIYDQGPGGRQLVDPHG